jgi:Flp pilus assembly protein TadD
MEVAVDTVLTDLTCTVCGSHFSLVDQSQSTRMAPPLSTMGRFELVERIGVGGFGSVWKARDNELDRTVAIKIPRQGAMTPEEQGKFFREARAAAQLRHPNIVSVHEVGRDGDSVYIVSDFIRGVTLGDWLTGHQLTSLEAAELCAKIADALHHAHEQGVIHRDLKPANIMIDGDGQPHLMDFGLARRDVGEITVTMDGQVIGTPAYMSPEQALGEAHVADRRSDVYSLGVILFQLLTGERPFRGNARMLMHQAIHDEPPSPRKLNGSVPKDLETITLKCLEKHSTRRYFTCAELAAELRRFLSGETIRARPVGPTERAWRWYKRNRLVACLGTAVALLLITGAVISMTYAIEARKQARELETERRRTISAYREAIQLTDRLFASIGEDQLLNTPALESVRNQLFEAAVQHFSGLALENTHDPNLQFDLAASYDRLAGIKHIWGDNVTAAEMARRAVEIQEQLAREHPKIVAYVQSLASSYERFAIIQCDLESADAHLSLSRALSLRSRLATDFPHDPTYQLHLAKTQHSFGYLQQTRGNSQVARGELEQALAIQRKLAAKFPDVAEYQSDLGQVVYFPSSASAEVREYVKPPIRQLRTLVGQKQTVEFRIRAVGWQQRLYLNAGAAFPNPNRFAAIIEPDQVRKLATILVNIPGEQLPGKIVRVTGEIEEREGRLEIRIASLENQLELIETIEESDAKNRP